LLDFADAGIKMSLIHCHDALYWLLSALMLAGTAVPTGYEHSHAGGCDPHEHQADLHDHCNSDCPHHHDEHPSSTQPRFVLASSETSHSHLSLFGIELHVPDSDAPSDNDGERQSPIEHVIATLGQPFTLGIRDNGTGDQTLQATAVLACETRMCVRPSIRPSAPVTFSTLCDAARRELTGVLRC
jgi:hypothetical protein